MSRFQMVAAACILLLGILIGVFAGSHGPDLEEIEATLAPRFDALRDAHAERVAALETQIGEVSARLGPIEETARAGAEAAGGLADDVGARIEGLSESIGAAIGSATATQRSAFESGLADLRARIDEAPPAAPAAAPAAPEAAPEAAEAASDSDPEADLAAPVGLTAGQTEVLSGGAIRVFVSRIDDAAGTARLAINGVLTDIAAGQSSTLVAGGEDCQVTVTQIDRGHVALGGGCGGDLPDPEGVTAGNTVMLGEGAVRVFVSGVAEDGQSARIAVNGVSAQSADLGEAVDVTVDEQTCSVTVDGIDRGHVKLGYACGS